MSVAMPSCAGIFVFAMTTAARPMTTMPHEVPLPWGPPPPNSAELIPYLRNTSRPKLAYSTYIGWYEDGGLNETSLDDQVDAMATRLRSLIYRVMRSGRIPARCRYRPNDEGGKQCVWVGVCWGGYRGNREKRAPHDIKTDRNQRPSLVPSYAHRPHGWTHVLHDYNWQVCGSTFNITMGCVHVDDYGRLLPDPQRYPSTQGGAGWRPFVDRTHARGIAFGAFTPPHTHTLGLTQWG